MWNKCRVLERWYFWLQVTGQGGTVGQIDQEQRDYNLIWIG